MSHIIDIVKTPEGVGLEIRPPLAWYELEYLRRNPRTTSIANSMVETTDYSGWGLPSDDREHAISHEQRVADVALNIVKVLEANGIIIDIL